MSRLDELIQGLCPNGVEYVPIINLAEIGTGSHNTNEELDDGKYPFFVRSQTPRRLNTYDFDEKAIITAGDGVGVGKVFHYIEGKYALHQRAYRIHVISDKLLPKYLLHYMKASFLSYMEMNAVNSSVTSVRKPMLEKYRIPVPPLEIQYEIIRILDSFTAISSELNAELEKEFIARRKQYNYYRDTLLSFDNTVKKVKLKDIAVDIYRGAGIKREEVTETGVPCVRYGEIYTTYNTWFDACVSHTKLGYVSNPKYFEHGDILFAITGESVEDIAKSVAYIGNEKCLAGGDIVVLKHNQEPRYLAHVLSTYEARQQKSKGKIKSKVVHSSVPAIEDIEIPLPSMEVQKRYADKTLQHVSEETAKKSKKAVTNDIIMAVTSENVEDVCKCVAWLGKEDIAVSGHTAIIHHNQNAKYLAYYFHTSYFEIQKRKLAHGTKVIEVTPDKLGDLFIPLPAKDEQDRIVEMLDRFDTLCNDISEGLPAEIDARQKQYEYYREKLLNFKELSE